MLLYSSEGNIAFFCRSHDGCRGLSRGYNYIPLEHRMFAFLLHFGIVRMTTESPVQGWIPFALLDTGLNTDISCIPCTCQHLLLQCTST